MCAREFQKGRTTAHSEFQLECFASATSTFVCVVLSVRRDYTDVSQAMAASLATFFKQIGLTDGSGVLENYNSFNTKDRKASWLKTSRKVSDISVLSYSIYCDAY